MSLNPEAFPNTPAGPTSASVFPKTLDFDKSLSPRRSDATSCVTICFFVNLPLASANLGSYGDSRTINFLLPVVSVGSIIVLIVCFGALSPCASLAIIVARCSASAAVASTAGFTNTTSPFGFLYTPPTFGIGKLLPEVPCNNVPKSVGGTFPN